MQTYEIRAQERVRRTEFEALVLFTMDGVHSGSKVIDHPRLDQLFLTLDIWYKFIHASKSYGE